MTRTLIVEDYVNCWGEKEWRIDVLKEGYNIIDFTIYDDELAMKIIEAIKREEK